MKKLIVILISLTSIIYANNLPNNSVVKIHVSKSIPNYKQPWQTSNRIQVNGSGVIIKDHYIITNAHVVSDSKFVQISKGNETKRFTASVEFISHQADLALLKVIDKKFYEGTEPLEFSEELNTGDSVTVLGYPLGGMNLSTTKGVVSRIELNRYVWSYEYILSIQIDAAINGGNSGGAAIDQNNNIVGIVMQSFSKSSSDNIGYIIPSIIVKTFLEDIKDGKVDGYDNSKTFIAELTNKALKDYLNIKNDQGVLVTNVEENEDALKVGDIIIEIENKKVFNDGKINTKYGLQPMKYMEFLKPVGEKTNLKIIRNNKIKNIKYTLKTKSEIIKKEYFKDPRYLIYGGLIFSPLTKNLLLAENQYIRLFENYYDLEERAKDAKEGVAVLREKFTHEINEGYTPYLNLVYAVNGTKVNDFEHFVKLIDKSNNEYTIVEFIDMEGTKYVFDTKLTEESFEEIKNIYGLTGDRRVATPE